MQQITLTHVKKNYQVTIPRRIREIVGIKEGDIMQINVRGKEMILKPKTLIDNIESKRQEWIKSLIETGIKNPAEISVDEIVKSCKETRKEAYQEFYGKKQK